MLMEGNRIRFKEVIAAMGYRSDVTIVCGEKASELLQKACGKHDFMPDVKLDGEFHVLCWDCVKWYESNLEVQALNSMLDRLNKMKTKDFAYAYKQFISGEINEDIEVRCNNAGKVALENYCGLSTCTGL